MERISNKNCREYVEAKKDFKGNNLYGINLNGLYVVYSYGSHFPLYVFINDTKKWYENIDKCSSSTSKHKSQSRPLNGEVIFKEDTKFLRSLIYSLQF
jgi:hypothetical protein